MLKFPILRSCWNGNFLTQFKSIEPITLLCIKLCFWLLKSFFFCFLYLQPNTGLCCVCWISLMIEKKKITSNFEGLRWICMSILKSFMVKKWVLLFEKFSSWMIFLFLGNMMVEMLYFGFADLFLTFSLIHVTRSGP